MTIGIPSRRLIMLAVVCVSTSASASASAAAAAAADDARWFPRQPAPKGIVRTISEDQFPEPRLATRMMVQSVAGLAAKAVNDRRCDELVWVTTGNADVERWYTRLVGRRPPLEVRGV